MLNHTVMLEVSALNHRRLKQSTGYLSSEQYSTKIFLLRLLLIWFYILENLIKNEVPVSKCVNALKIHFHHMLSYTYIVYNHTGISYIMIIISPTLLHRLTFKPIFTSRYRYLLSTGQDILDNILAINIGEILVNMLFLLVHFRL